MVIKILLLLLSLLTGNTQFMSQQSSGSCFPGMLPKGQMQVLFYTTEE